MRYFILFGFICLSLAAYGEEDTSPVQGVARGIAYSVAARTPEQIAAFYEGRGFSQAVIDELSQACFLTVTLLNRRKDIVWLELDRWHFVDADGHVLKRLGRPYWNALWERLEVPPANRATFGWTQLPERRDLHPTEPVGGNVTIVPVEGELTLRAHFRVADKKAAEFTIEVPGLHCRDSTHD